MDILLISQYILIVSIIIFLIAAIRITTHKTIATGIIGSTTFSLGIGLLLLAYGTIYSIGFCPDVATALLILGIVDTIAFSTVLRRGKHD
jgi:energy-converting hydrogenase B subunit B